MLFNLIHVERFFKDKKHEGWQHSQVGIIYYLLSPNMLVKLASRQLGNSCL